MQCVQHVQSVCACVGVGPFEFPVSSLSSYGDEDGTGAATDLTAVPGAAISCLTDLYELNLLGNAITEIPPLGTGGLGALLPLRTLRPHAPHATREQLARPKLGFLQVCTAQRSGSSTRMCTRVHVRRSSRWRAATRHGGAHACLCAVRALPLSMKRRVRRAGSGHDRVPFALRPVRPVRPAGARARGHVAAGGQAVVRVSAQRGLPQVADAVFRAPPTAIRCGPGLVNLGIVIMEDNLIVSIPTNTFTGLTELSQISFKTNRIEVVPPALLSGFPKLFTVDFSDNRIKSVPVNLFGTDATTAKTYFAGNVLQCNAFDKNGAQGCTCNKAHAQYVSGASEFDDVDTANGGAISRVCRTGPTALSEIEALKVIMASLETKMTTIEGFGATIDTMATTTTNIAADLAQIHLKLDAAGCPQINRRFGRSAQ